MLTKICGVWAAPLPWAAVRIQQLRACQAAAVPTVRHLAGKTGTIRTAEFLGAPHLVVPVIALVEGVVRPANSSGPELALASEFGHHPRTWNGRPVMVGHPTRHGEHVSANDVAILEAGSVGAIFSAALDDRRLTVEAWIDETRAKELGGDAKELVERLLDDEQVEVSVGVLLDLEEHEGEHDGQAYRYVWRHVGPDHLAMLRKGEVGACSIEMGCGAPRVAAREGNAMNQSTLDALKHSLKTLFGRGTVSESDRLTYAATVEGLDSLGLRAALTDTDLRGALEIALRDAEPGFVGILAVDDAERVIYHAFADGGGGLRLYQRSFTAKAKGTVAVKDDKTEVRAETAFVSVSAAPAAPKAACGCGGDNTNRTAGGAVMEKSQRISALIASKQHTFSAEHQAFLESLTDEQLTTLEAADEKVADPPAAPAQGAQPSPAASGEQSEEEYLKTAPKSIKDLVARDKAQRAERKTALVSVLTTAQTEYSEAELNEMEVDDLERMARVAQAPVDQPNFSGRGVPRSAAAEEDVYAMPPDPYQAALEQRTA